MDNLSCKIERKPIRAVEIALMLGEMTAKAVEREKAEQQNTSRGIESAWDDYAITESKPHIMDDWANMYMASMGVDVCATK